MVTDEVGTQNSCQAVTIDWAIDYWQLQANRATNYRVTKGQNAKFENSGWQQINDYFTNNSIFNFCFLNVLHFPDNYHY